MGSLGCECSDSSEDGCACLVSRLRAYVKCILSLKMDISMVACGVAVLAGMTPVQDPYANFKHPFEGSYWNGNALATAFVGLIQTINWYCWS